MVWWEIHLAAAAGASCGQLAARAGRRCAGPTSEKLVAALLLFLQRHPKGFGVAVGPFRHETRRFGTRETFRYVESSGFLSSGFVCVCVCVVVVLFFRISGFCVFLY